MAAVGIHFGNTSCSLAVFKDGRTEIVSNDVGERITPSAVLFSGNDVTVGLSAKHSIVRNGKQVVRRCKQILGKNFSDPSVQRHIKSNPCKVIDKGGQPCFQVEVKEKPVLYSPKDISIYIFKKLQDTARAHAHRDLDCAVLTAPTYFDEEQRKCLWGAAKSGGFNVVRMISEPAAAVLAYGIGQDDISLSSKVLVYSFGGCSLDVTVLEVHGGMYRIITSESDNTLQGSSFEELLVQLLANEFKKKWKLDVTENSRSMAKLLVAAETCKHVLSSRDSAPCSVESLYEGIDFQCSVSRARFESHCSSLFQQCLEPVERALQKAGLNKADIDKVILAGGMSRIPKLQQLLKDFFENKEILSHIAPDAVVAYGAAVQASLLLDQENNTQEDEDCQISCTSRDLCIAICPDMDLSNISLKTVFSKFTPIPSKRTLTFSNDVENQESLCLRIYEAEGSDLASATLIGKMVLRDLPEAAKESLKIVCYFHLRRDGSLHVTLSEKVSGKAESLTVEQHS